MCFLGVCGGFVFRAGDGGFVLVFHLGWLSRVGRLGVVFFLSCTLVVASIYICGGEGCVGAEMPRDGVGDMSSGPWRIMLGREEEVAEGCGDVE